MDEKQDLKIRQDISTHENNVGRLREVLFAHEDDIEVWVNIYGVTQKRIIRVERVIEAGKEKLLLFLEEHTQVDRDEKIRAISG